MENVLFLISDLGIGGSERKTINIMNTLTARGKKCHLLYLNSPDTLRPLVSKEVNIHCLERTVKFDVYCMKKYRDYVNTNKIECICCMDLYALFNHKLALAGIKNKPRMFVAINTSIIKSLKGKLHMFLYAKLLRKNCQIIFGSELQKRMWTTRYRINPSYGRVIYNGIDLNYFNSENILPSREETRQKFGINKEEIVLGMVARFSPEKAHSHLIMAAKKIVNMGHKIKILLVGSGEEREKIIQLVSRLNMNDNVIFLEEVLDIRPALVSMDIFVLTSIAVETFSNSALEAMAMNKPVILSDIGGAREMVEDGFNGFLFPPGDVGALESRIRTIIENDLFVLMGSRGRNIVEKRFTMEKMVSEYEKQLVLN